LLSLAAILVLWGLGGALAVASEAPEAKEQDEEAAPAVISPYLNWQFNGSLEKVRESLQAVLKEDGLTLKEDAKSPGTFVTDLVVFDEKRFGVNVSTPPPRANPKYPYLQAIAVNAGRYGLEGRLSSAGPQATRLEIRALIEVSAINTRKGGTVWIPRYSNGTIEHLAFSRIALKMLAPASGDTPSR